MPESRNVIDDLHAVGDALTVATEYGLATEVITWALYAMKKDPTLTVIGAIQEGLEEWIK
jgi:hypothetical protein